MKLSVTAVAVGALVVVNGCLFTAVNHRLGTSAAATTQSTKHASASTSAAVRSSRAAPQSASAPVSSSQPPQADAVYVTALNQDKAWRVFGSTACAGAPKVQATSDAGQSWQQVVPPPAGAVTGAATDSTGRLVVTGLSVGDCKPTTWALQGTTWSTSAAGTWGRTGDAGPDVLRKGEPVTACDAGSVRDTAATTQGLDVLCSTGEVRALSDSGSTGPQTLFQSSAVLSIATEPDGTLVIARTTNGCEGIQLAAVSNGHTQPIACVKGAGGPVDLTFAGYYGWLVSKQSTWTGRLTGAWSKQ